MAARRRRRRATDKWWPSDSGATEPPSQSDGLSNDVDQDLIEHVQHCVESLAEDAQLPAISLLTKKSAQRAVTVLEEMLAKLDAKLRLARRLKAELRRRREGHGGD